MATDTAEQEERTPRVRKKRKIKNLRNRETARRTRSHDRSRSPRQQRRDKRKAGTLKAKREYLEVQNIRTTWSLPVVYPAISLGKWAFGFGFSLVAAILAVSGFYDVVLESHVPLRVYGAIVVALGVVFIVSGWFMNLRNRQEGRGTASTVAAMVFGVVLLLFSGFVFYTYSKHAMVTDSAGTHPVVTQTDAYHYWISSAPARHLFMRKLPEGLVAGLLSVYWFWNCGVRASKGHKYYYKPFGWFSVPGDDRDAETWKILFVPVLAIASAVATWAGGWYLFLWHNHDQEVSHWIRHALPYHISVVPAGTGLLDAVVASVTVAWPAFVIGFVSARFWGRAPAGGPIHDAVYTEAWVRIQRCGQLERHNGHRGALAWWQSRQHQGTIEQQWLEGLSWTHPTERGISGPVAYATYQLDQIGKGPRVVFRTAQAAMLPLMIVGFIYVYIIAKGH